MAAVKLMPNLSPHVTDPSVDYCVAVFPTDTPTIQAQSVRKCQNYNIMHLDWFMRCLDEEKVVPWKEGDLWCEKVATPADRMQTERMLKLALFHVSFEIVYCMEPMCIAGGKKRSRFDRI